MKKVIAYLQDPEPTHPLPSFNSFSLRGLELDATSKPKIKDDFKRFLKKIEVIPSAQLVTDIFSRASKRELANEDYQTHTQKLISEILQLIAHYKLLEDSTTATELKKITQEYMNDAKANCMQVLLHTTRNFKLQVMQVVVQSNKVAKSANGCTVNLETPEAIAFKLLAALALEDAVTTQVHKLLARDQFETTKKRKEGTDQHAWATHLVDAGRALNIADTLGIQTTEVMQNQHPTRKSGIDYAWIKLYQKSIYHDWVAELTERISKTQAVKVDGFQKLCPDENYSNMDYIDSDGQLTPLAVEKLMHDHYQIVTDVETAHTEISSEAQLFAAIVLNDGNLLESALDRPDISDTQVVELLSANFFTADSGQGPLSLTPIQLIYGQQNRELSTALLRGLGKRKIDLEFLLKDNLQYVVLQSGSVTQQEQELEDAIITFYALSDDINLIAAKLVNINHESKAEFKHRLKILIDFYLDHNSIHLILPLFQKLKESGIEVDYINTTTTHWLKILDDIKRPEHIKKAFSQCSATEKEALLSRAVHYGFRACVSTLTPEVTLAPVTQTRLIKTCLRGPTLFKLRKIAETPPVTKLNKKEIIKQKEALQRLQIQMQNQMLNYRDIMSTLLNTYNKASIERNMKGIIKGACMHGNYGIILSLEKLIDPSDYTLALKQGLQAAQTRSDQVGINVLTRKTEKRPRELN